MAIKLVNGNEVRVPGSAMPDGQRRQGMLGKLDGIGMREFQKLPIYEKKSLISSARLDQAGLAVSVGIKDRWYEPRGNCGLAYLNRIKVEVASKGFEPSCVLGKEYLYRDAYSSANDDWRLEMEGAKIIGAKISGERLELEIRIAGRNDYRWNEKVEVALRRKPDGENQKENASGAANKEAARIIGEIKERQKNAIRPSNQMLGTTTIVGYDEPRNAGLAISTDGKFAVFVIEEMIDWNAAAGKQRRWTAYRMGFEGSARAIAAGCSYERADKTGKIAITGVSDAGIELQTGEGLTVVHD